MIARKILIKLILLTLTFSLQARAKVAEAVLGEYVLQLKDGYTVEDYLEVASSFVTFKTQLSDNLVLVTAPSVIEASAVIGIAEEDIIKYAEPNYIYHHTTTPNDPKLSNLWGLINKGQSISGNSGLEGFDINMEKAWNIRKDARDIIVAVIDTGVDYNHVDLKENMWVNEAEKNGVEGYDDDRNGYVDDVYGYNFSKYKQPTPPEKDPEIPPEDENLNIANSIDGALPDPMDDNGHGTHVAGTIGARGDNDIGVVGVAWNVKIMAVKFLSARGGGTLAGAAQAIQYAIKNKAHILNNSWGGGGYSKILKEVIEQTKEEGMIFVAASGNSAANIDKGGFYPATYPIDNILSVGSSDMKGKRSRFSNYSKTKVHVLAPGSSILSTTPQDQYGYKSGTSMAAPHVSGLAALMWAQEPDFSYKKLINRMIRTSKPKLSLKTSSTSRGMVDAYAALTGTIPDPDPEDPENWAKYTTYNYSTPHPYPTGLSEEILLSVPGAQRLSLFFSKFHTEKFFDKVKLIVDGEVVHTMHDNLGERVWSPIIEGDTVTLRFESNARSGEEYGFDLKRIYYE